MSLLVPVLAARQGTSFYNTLTNLGLLSNLKICLDAADLNSYDGSAQTWKDLSGNGNHFYRGATSSGGSDDPTFNGVAGRESLNEYFSYDGGDFFTLSVANPSWLNAAHKAGGKLSMAQWVYTALVTSPTTQAVGQSGDVGATSGAVEVTSIQATAMKPGLGILNDAGIAYTKSPTGLYATNTWNFFAVAYDFSTGTVSLNLNGTAENFTSQSLSTPSTGDATGAMQIGNDGSGGGSIYELTGSRIGEYAMWSAALSAAQLAALFTARRGKYGV